MREEKTAYISVLTTPEFKDGVKVTFFSLRRFTDREFIVLVNETISEEIVQELESLGMKVRRESSKEFSHYSFSEDMKKDRWYHTLFKLKIFGMTEYDRLVYLDSDMFVCGNIDELFSKAEFSAVPDKLFFPKYSRGGINAGVISFHPEEALEKGLMECIPRVLEKMRIFGDQDVINEYFGEWEKEEEKHLPVKYNACFYELDSYGEKKPLVVHFILGSKPWMWSATEVFLKQVKWLLQGKKEQVAYLRRYRRVLKKVR